jgi:hypothetical protein
VVDIRSIATFSHPSCHEQETEGEATSHSRAGRPRHAYGISASTSHHPHDDVAASQPKARGDCHSAVVSSSPHFSPAGLLPQMTSWYDTCSTMTE